MERVIAVFINIESGLRASDHVGIAELSLSKCPTFAVHRQKNFYICQDSCISVVHLIYAINS